MAVEHGSPTPLFPIMGVSEDKRYLVLRSLIIGILLFRVLY